jgi:YVTN family beta-propeller protein
MRNRTLTVFLFVLAIAHGQSSYAELTLADVRVAAPADGAKVTGVVTVKATAPSGTTVTFRVDGKAIGTDTSAPYSFEWDTRSVSPGPHLLRVEARQKDGSVGASGDVTVIVTASADESTVTITSPDNGDEVTGTVTVMATASTGITLVTFRVDGKVIGTDNASPYRVSWDTTEAAAGSHTLRADGRDGAGKEWSSPAIKVTVGKGDNKLPTVTLTSPDEGSTHARGAAVKLTANAVDGDGSVARVEFYEDSKLLGSDTTAPFALTWTPAITGSHQISAHAVDKDGSVAKSKPVNVKVTDGSKSSIAVFEPSVNDSIVNRYVLEIFRSGVDVETGTPSATQDLGKPPVVSGECSVDIAATLRSLAPGTYVATVTAVGSTARTRSAPSPSFVVTASLSFTTSLVDHPDEVGHGRTDGEALSPPTAATRANGLLWATNSTTGMVTAFDATTGDVLATIPVGLTPAGLTAPAGAGKIYVADEGSDTVSVISKATFDVIATISLPAPLGRRPHQVAASPDGSLVYVGELGANVIDVIDTATDAVVARFGAGWPGTTIRGVVPDQSGEVVYAVSAAASASISTLAALDVRTGAWLWHLPINGEANGLVVQPDGRSAVIARRDAGTLAVIDLERRAVTREFDLGPGYEAGDVQLNADGRLLVVAHRQPDRVGIVDPSRGGDLRTVAVAGATSAPTTLSAAQRSYVCVSDGTGGPAAVLAIDASAQTVVSRFRFPGGGSPHSAIFDPR